MGTEDDIEDEVSETADDPGNALDRSRRLAAVYLAHVWRDMRDDAGPMARARAIAAIRALRAAEVLAVDAAVMWSYRFDTCPGHTDESGRVWCAYCGDLPAGDPDWTAVPGDDRNDHEPSSPPSPPQWSGLGRR